VAARTDALVRRVAELSRWPAGGGGDGLALGLVDAVLDADATSLSAVLAALREARAGADEGADERLAGWLDAAIALVYWSLERITPEATLGGVARGTRAFDFLSAVGERPGVGSAELRELLETDETQVSRTGRQLLERGLASRRKAGRQALWDLTPRGRRTLELVAARPPEPAPAPAPDSFWMEAIRRGFAGAGGDEPGLRREVDPTRERIVETTLELHNLQGIVDTTVADIARSAGVPVETVEAYFPTQDDLIKGCGQHVLESLRLPPPEAAPVIFEGTQGASDRVRRLVETLFETYERAGVSLEGGRRVRVELPLVGESMDQVDIALDALVREALGPDRSNEAVAAVGALTDVSVWRALRELGVSPEHSVEKAALTVDAWLEGATVKAAPAP
jgi:AcrR family transcriptional regulator